MTIWRNGGGVPREIERNWTFPRYQALRRHFDENGPPLYEIGAALAGIKLKTPKTVKTSGGQTFNTPEEMAAAFAEMKATGAF